MQLGAGAKGPVAQAHSKRHVAEELLQAGKGEVGLGALRGAVVGGLAPPHDAAVVGGRGFFWPSPPPTTRTLPPSPPYRQERVVFHRWEGGRVGEGHTAGGWLSVAPQWGGLISAEDRAEGG